MRCGGDSGVGRRGRGVGGRRENGGMNATDPARVWIVSWAAPATSGYPFPGVTNQIQAYEVQVASGESIEYYNTMAFPAWQPSFAGPEAGCTGASPCARGGSAYVGGNWYRLLEKNGGGAWLNYVVTNNLWDFWQGWLRLNSDIGRNNWVRVLLPRSTHAINSLTFYLSCSASGTSSHVFTV